MQKFIFLVLCTFFGKGLVAQGFGNECGEGPTVYTPVSTSNSYSDGCNWYFTDCTTTGGPCSEVIPWQTQCTTTISFGSGCGGGSGYDNPYTTTTTYETDCDICTEYTVHHTNGQPDDVTTSCSPKPGGCTSNNPCPSGGVFSTDCNMCIGGPAGPAACPIGCINPALNSSDASILSGATPSLNIIGTEKYGRTTAEDIIVTISACLENNVWKPIIISITGHYALQTQINPSLPGCTTSIQQIGGNTNIDNFCKQAGDLRHLGAKWASTGECPLWYNISAVQAHEEVHVTRLEPALEQILLQIESLIESVSIPNTGQTEADAILQFEALNTFNEAIGNATELWKNKYYLLILNDHDYNGPCDQAEMLINGPLLIGIRNQAITNGWPSCVWLPPY